MSRLKVLYISIFALSISACSILDPFVDRRRNAGANDMAKLYVGASTPQNPAICYNTLTTNFEEIQKIADEECRKHKTGIKAKPIKEKYFDCKLFLPNRMYFECEN